MPEILKFDREDSQKISGKELAKHLPDLLTTQEVRWDKGN